MSATCQGFFSIGKSIAAEATEFLRTMGGRDRFLEGCGGWTLLLGFFWDEPFWLELGRNILGLVFVLLPFRWEVVGSSFCWLSEHWSQNGIS